MTCRRCAPLVLVVLLLPAAAAARQTGAELRDRGLSLGFDLDHAGAVAAFKASIAADPESLEGYRLLATALWTSALFQQGAITADDFLGDTGSPTRARRSSPELDNAAQDLLRRTELLDRTTRQAARPTVEAIYQIGAAYRFLSMLAGTIEGSQWHSLGAARRAYQEHARVLAIDPRRADASFTVGMYRFWAAHLPMWSRLVVRVAGVDADAGQGLRLVEYTASHEGSTQASAMFGLIGIYTRLSRHDDALNIVTRLQQRFPGNRILWLEAARIQFAAGRAADARTSVERGLRMLETETRPRAYGELARWRYQYGVSLAQLKQRDAATEQFRSALQGDALDWVRGRTHLELGKLANNAGGRTRAAEEFRIALRTCASVDDEICVRDTRAELGK